MSYRNSRELAGLKICWLPAFCVLLIAGFQTVAAQDTSGGPPTLHQRTEPTYGDVRSPKNPQVPSTLPSEASGEYLLGKPGDVIEIILDSNGLTGYMSLIGRTDRDKDAALTYLFDDTELNAKTLRFTTRPVHGKSYIFEGTIVRGPSPTKTKDGYYLLKGTLTLHDVDKRTDQARRVELPLARTVN
jgi:hypothetical protein